MSTPDKNFLSISNNPQVGFQHLGNLVPPDGTYDDTLKFSNSQNGTIRIEEIVGGQEDCVDLNNGCRNLNVHAERWYPRGEYVATVKGGTRDCTLTGQIVGRPRTVHVDLGNRSDQSKEITKGIRLGFTTPDGSPVRVRLLLAERPELLNAHEQDYDFVFPSQLPLWMRRFGFWVWELFRRQLTLSFLMSMLAFLVCAGCAKHKPQRGGNTSATLGGVLHATTAGFTAPENPQMASTQTVRKTITRDFVPTPRDDVPAVHEGRPAAIAAGRGASVQPPILRETATEEVVTSVGAAQKDTARELGARLSNMRGVMWVGVALLVLGPVVGWKLGWFVNGCIAGAVGLGLIVLATVLPGNEAWFGLLGLGLIPLVAFVYYRAQYDANKNGVPDRLEKTKAVPASTPSAS